MLGTMSALSSAWRSRVITSRGRDTCSGTVTLTPSAAPCTAGAGGRGQVRGEPWVPLPDSAKRGWTTGGPPEPYKPPQEPRAWGAGVGLPVCGRTLFRSDTHPLFGGGRACLVSQVADHAQRPSQRISQRGYRNRGHRGCQRSRTYVGMFAADREACGGGAATVEEKAGRVKR